MFGHSWIVVVLLLIIVLIIFGPGKLSQVGGALGKSIREFRKSTNDPDEAGGARDNGSSKPGAGSSKPGTGSP